MKTERPRRRRHRYPARIIGHAVRLRHGFSLSFREVEDLLEERGIVVSYETILQGCTRFGSAYARTPNLCCYGNRDGNQVDLLIERKNQLYPAKIRKTAAPSRPSCSGRIREPRRCRSEQSRHP